MVEDNGSIVCWGSSHHGQTSPPLGEWARIRAMGADWADHCGSYSTDDTAHTICWSNANGDELTSCPAEKYVHRSHLAAKTLACAGKHGHTVVGRWAASRAKPKMTVKGGMVSWASYGDSNGSPPPNPSFIDRCSGGSGVAKHLANVHEGALRRAYPVSSGLMPAGRAGHGRCRTI